MSISGSAANRPETDDKVELLAYRLEKEVQDRLVTWAKQRFSVITLAVGIAGTLGIVGIITNSLNNGVNNAVNTEIQKQAQTIDAKIDAYAKIIEGRLEFYSDSVTRGSEQLSNVISSAETGRIELERAIADAARAAMEAREAVKKATAEADAAATAARNKINEIQEVLNLAKESAVDIRERHAEIRDNLEAFGDSVYLKVDYSLEKLSEHILMLRTMAERITYLEDRTGNVLNNAEHLQTNQNLDSKEGVSSGDNELDADLRHIKSIGGKKVILFFHAGRGLSHLAEKAAVDLRLEGFEAEVWYTSDKPQMQAKQDIRVMIGGIADLLFTNDIAIVSSEASRPAAESVRGVLQEHIEFVNVEVFGGKPHFAEQMRVTRDGEIITDENVILVYLIVPDRKDDRIRGDGVR